MLARDIGGQAGRVDALGHITGMGIGVLRGDHRFHQLAACLQPGADRYHRIAGALGVQQQSDRFRRAFLDAQHADIAGAAEQRERCRFVGKPAGLLAQRLHVEVDAFGFRPQRLAEPRGEIGGAGLVRTVEQVEPRVGVELLDRGADLRRVGLHWLPVPGAFCA